MAIQEVQAVEDFFDNLNIHLRSTDELATLDNAKQWGTLHLITGTQTLEGTAERTFGHATYPSDSEVVMFFTTVSQNGNTMKWLASCAIVYDNDLKSPTVHNSTTGSGYSLECCISGTERNYIESGTWNRFQETMGYSDWTGTTINFNGKIFCDRAHALLYAQNGDVTGLVKRYMPPTNFEETLYIHETKYTLNNDGTKTKTSEIFTEYRTKGNAVLVLTRGDYSSGNLFLRYNGSMIDVHNMLTDSWSYAQNSLAQYYYYDNGTYKTDSSQFISVLDTNIPIVGSNADYNEYLTTGDDSLIENLQDVHNNLTGTELTTTELNSTRCGSPFVTIYLLSIEELAKVGSWLYRSDTRALFESCLWGDKPIEMVVDVTWIPLTLTQFALPTTTKTIKFGDVECMDVDTAYTTARTATATNDVYGTPVTICNTTVLGTYNDWRDYECSYKVYLPYYGLIDIDANLIVGANLKIDTNYFITGKVLKHYVYINGIMYGEYEVNIGCTIALSSVDQKAKMDDKLNGISNIVGGAISLGTGVELGMPQNMVGGVNSIVNGVAQSYKGLSHNLWGNNSASANVNDVAYPYIVIDTPVYVYPKNIHSRYNYPCYTITTLSNFSGYVEVSDIKLNGMGSFSESEKNKVKELLRNGVIL